MKVENQGVNSLFILDTDSSVREMLSIVFRIEGYDVRTFQSEDQFWQALNENEPDCVVLEANIAGASGVDILRRLSSRLERMPTFMISAQSDVQTAVAAMRSGATDFIEKPFESKLIVNRVRQAIEQKQVMHKDRTPTSYFPGASSLTPREREVVGLIVSGASNKEAGRTLGISPRTVEVHRARIMEKLDAKNAADLVRIVLLGEKRKVS